MIKRWWKDWDWRIKSVCWAVFAYQYLILLSNLTFQNDTYLLPETITLLTGSLLVAASLQFMIIGSVWFRALLQYAALTGFVYLYTAQLNPGTILRLKTGLLQWGSTTSEMLFWTYLLYSFLVGALFLALMTWSRTKGHVFAALMFSIVIFSITDSFTRIYLWDQVFFMVMSALLLIMWMHFRQFRQRHPQGWNSLIEYPAQLMTRIALLLLIVILASVFTPTVKPAITDPYTAFQSWRGKEVIKLGKPTGPKEVNADAGGSRSGYSRDDSELGGGFEYDHSPVFKVETDEKSYWRGETRSTYTGDGWIPSTTEQLLSLREYTTGQTLPTRSSETTELETKKSNYTITMLKDDEYPVLFGSYQISQVGNLDGYQNRLDHVSVSEKDQSLHWTPLSRDKSYPVVYQLTSQIPIVDEPLLRESTVNTQAGSTGDMAEYLQLPEDLPARVRELAQSITANETNDYDKVKQIESYLKQSFPYTNQPDTSKAVSDDFVDAFLFEVQEGYCDYYSTSMAVLVRSLDIPARWVKGYTSGFQQQTGPFIGVPEEYAVMEQEGGEFTVLNSDAHSWVEVYFEGFGWIPFEPTAQFSLPTLYKELPDATQQPAVPDATDQTDDKDDKKNGDRSSVSWLWISVWSVVLLGMALIGYLLYRWDVPFAWLRARKQKKNKLDEPQYRIVYEVEKLMRYGERHGFPTLPSDTVKEWVRRVGEQRGDLREPLQHLYRLFEKAKYSNVALQDAEWQEALSKVEHLQHAMKEKAS
ncbi:transglutaminase TgpA family protein [Marinicrinis sediminis]|uniref:DUF3488 and DUF4129 domain-containing transglutaminase family protein n=1 Tax=Marinicrinis sediminis TaxID=1652465 RepID=A0ABW5R9E8_9BACL